MRIADLVYWRAATWCKRASYGWGHHEPGFIDEQQVSVPLLRLSFDPRKLFRFLSSNFCLIAFCCLLCRPYSRPTQVIGQDVPHMAAAKLDCKMPLNNFPDTGCRPQVVFPTVQSRPLREQLFELIELSITQTTGATATRFSLERLPCLYLSHPNI